MVQRPDDQYVDHYLDEELELPVRRRRARGLLPALAAAAIIIGAGAGGVALLRPAAAPTDRAAPAPAPAAPPGSAASSVAPTPAPTSTGARAVPTSLRQQAAADKVTVQKLVGRWVPQISSKAPGLVVDGVTYDEKQIWSEFRAVRTKYPDVALVRSGDYRSFAQPGHWVVVLARTFATADAANAWCDRQGFDAEDCFAKRLSRTGGPNGNTVSRR